MEDRLADLGIGNKSPALAETPAEEILPEFSRKTNAIRTCLKKVKDNSKKINQLKGKHESSTLSDQEKAISEELDKLIAENTKNCLFIKSELEEIDEQVAKAQKTEKDEPETRIKDITYRALKSEFADVLKESQNTQIEFKTAMKTKIVRQAKIIDPTLTAEQIDEVCNDPDGASKLLANKMLGKGHVKLQNEVADIQDKYKDIQKLEKSVQIVHQMFVDLQMLVQAQGEMLDNIELNIQEAKDYVQKANKQLDTAKKQHIIYKKYRCCLLITLLVIIAVCVLVPIILKT